MTPREEILSQYNVDAEGVILSPGKYQGELLFVPYFWETDGGADSIDQATDGTPLYSFVVQDADREEFPELKEIDRLTLFETNDGFVVWQQ